MVGGQVRFNHHGRTLFPLPSPERTTITKHANWSCDDDLDIEGDDEAYPVAAAPPPKMPQGAGALEGTREELDPMSGQGNAGPLGPQEISFLNFSMMSLLASTYGAIKWASNTPGAR